MKKKIICILVMTLVISTTSASASSMAMSKDSNDTQTGSMGDPAPEILYIQDNNADRLGRDFDEGWTNYNYWAMTKNTLGGHVEIIVDWGDGTQSSMDGDAGYMSLLKEDGYSQGGTYTVKAKYAQYGSWSNAVTFPIKDHCDLDILSHGLRADPPKFRRGQKVDIIATVENLGSIPSKTTEVQFYVQKTVNGPFNVIEGPKTVPVIQPGNKVEIKLEDYPWPSNNGLDFRAKLKFQDGERTDINNQITRQINSKSRARQLCNPFLLEILNQMPLLKLILGI